MAASASARLSTSQATRMACSITLRTSGEASALKPSR
jgi:hypothetical protein